MSTPMYDIPEHLPFPVNEDGEGPAEGEDFHHWSCWCAARDACQEVPLSGASEGGSDA